MGKDKAAAPAEKVTAQAGEELAPVPTGPVTIKVPTDGQVGVYDGDKHTFYPVKDGAIVVPADHAAAVLASVPGSELKQETPAPKEK